MRLLTLTLTASRRSFNRPGRGGKHNGLSGAWITASSTFYVGRPNVFSGMQRRLRKAGRSGSVKDMAIRHVIVKLWPGKSEQQKKKLAEEITCAVTDTLHYG
jgi:hypothetical protein